MTPFGFPKPIKGTALLHSRSRRAERTKHEQDVMQEAKRLDGHACRVPACEFKSKKLPIDACHVTHRGMGGDPRGTRTTLDTVISLCRVHHGMLDAGQLDITPTTEAGTRGPCAFYRLTESGQMACVAVETMIGVSTARSPR